MPIGAEMGKASRYNRRVFICRTAGTQALRSKTSPDTISSTPGHVAVNPLPSLPVSARGMATGVAEGTEAATTSPVAGAAARSAPTSTWRGARLSGASWSVPGLATAGVGSASAAAPVAGSGAASTTLSSGAGGADWDASGGIGDPGRPFHSPGHGCGLASFEHPAGRPTARTAYTVEPGLE